VELKKILPNALSVFRLVDAILLFVLWKFSLKNSIFILLIFLGILSDFLDGFLARRLKATSRLGAILDPVADKVFVNTLFLLLYLEKLIPFYFLFAVILRDVLIILGAVILLKRKKGFTPAPLFVGKLCTLFLMFFLFSSWVHYYFGLFSSQFLQVFMKIAFLLIVVSGLFYARVFFTQERRLN
jgi:cardiolipin synthase